MESSQERKAGIIIITKIEYGDTDVVIHRKHLGVSIEVISMTGMPPWIGLYLMDMHSVDSILIIVINVKIEGGILTFARNFRIRKASPSNLWFQSILIVKKENSRESGRKKNSNGHKKISKKNILRSSRTTFSLTFHPS